jgi:cell division protein FtsB
MRLTHCIPALLATRTYSVGMADLSENSDTDTDTDTDTNTNTATDTKTKTKTVPVTSSPTFSTPPPAFPPPNPSENSDGRRLTILRVVALLALLALLAAVGMGLLWMSANSTTDKAEAARDRAMTETEVSAAEQAILEAELTTARADLDDARASTDALTAERDGAISELGAGAEDLAQLQTQAADLNDNNEQLAEEIATLRQELESTEIAIGDVDAPGATSFDIAASPAFASYIGETLTSRRGASRLDQTQSECFGTAIVTDIGLDGLGKGLTLTASAANNNIVVGAMQSAASTCNIDLSLVF